LKTDRPYATSRNFDGRAAASMFAEVDAAEPAASLDAESSFNRQQGPKSAPLLHKRTSETSASQAVSMLHKCRVHAPLRSICCPRSIITNLRLRSPLIARWSTQARAHAWRLGKPVDARLTRTARHRCPNGFSVISLPRLRCRSVQLESVPSHLPDGHDVFTRSMHKQCAQ
jgi:hypothetical protein